MVRISPATAERLNRLFSPETRRQAVTLLEEQCAELAMWRNAAPEGLERIRFAVLKVSQGNLETLGQAIERAQADWRDVLVHAGFAHDVNAHRDWRPAE